MAIDRELNSLGTSSTVVSTTWENDFQGDINNLKTYAADLEMIAGIIQGLVPKYNSVNQIIIPAGQCLSDDNTANIVLTSNLTVDLSVSGAGGLDTGSEAVSTWYYVWLIYNPTTTTVSAVFSISNSSPTLPSGYTKKRMLPIAVRNDDSGNILPFFVGEGWPFRPVILFRDFDTSATYRVLNAGAATTSFTNPGGGTNVSLSSFVPPISKEAVLNCVTVNVSGGTADTFIKNPDSASTTGQRVGTSGVTTAVSVNNNIRETTDASQNIAYRSNSTTTNLSIYVQGFVVTELTAVAATTSGGVSTPATNSPKGYISGLTVSYINASTVAIATGLCRDDSNSQDIEVISSLSVAFGTSGAGGLDAGAETANTWYYVWLIKNPTTGDVRGMFSISNSSPTLPSGYTLKRLLPIAVRNDDSSNIINFIVAGGWPYKPEVLFYDFDTSATYRVLNAGTATTAFTAGGGGTAVTLTSFVPPVSREVILQADTLYVSGGQAVMFVKPSDGQSTVGQKIASANPSASAYPVNNIRSPLSASQGLVYRNSLSTSSLTLYVQGFVVTEI